MSISAPLVWETCPVELLNKIFRYLQDNETDLVSASSTCRHWRHVGLDPSFWRHMTFRLPPDGCTRGQAAKYVKKQIKYLGVLGHHAQYISMGFPYFPFIKRRDVIDFFNTVLQGLSNRCNEDSPILSFEITDWYIPDYRIDFRFIIEIMWNILGQFMALLKNLRVLKIRYFCFQAETFSSILHCVLSPSFATTLQVLDIYNSTANLRFSANDNLRIGKLMEVLKSFHNLKELGLNYMLLNCATIEGVCQSMKSLQKLSIHYFYKSEEGGIITTTSWRAACRICPDLKVFCNYNYNLSNASDILVDGIPLVQVVVKDFFFPDDTGAFRFLCTRFMEHLVRNFKKSLQSVTLLVWSDERETPPPVKDDIVQFLAECGELRQATFSNDFVSEDLKEQIKQEVFQRSHRNVSFLRVVPVFDEANYRL